MTPRAISPLPVIAPPTDLEAPEIIVGNEKRMLLAALKRMPALARETDQAPAYEKGRAS